LRLRLAVCPSLAGSESQAYKLNHPLKLIGYVVLSNIRKSSRHLDTASPADSRRDQRCPDCSGGVTSREYRFMLLQLLQLLTNQTRDSRGIYLPHYIEPVSHIAVDVSLFFDQLNARADKSDWRFPCQSRILYKVIRAHINDTPSFKPFFAIPTSFRIYHNTLFTECVLVQSPPRLPNFTASSKPT
jgi:hypothetical protein